MLSFSNAIAEKEEEEEEGKDVQRRDEKKRSSESSSSSSSSRRKLPAFKVMMRWFYRGEKDTQNWIDICITLIRALYTHSTLRTRETHA